jgi:hypothetical protein
MTEFASASTKTLLQVFQSKEMIAALLGALIGGTVTLTATIMANRHNRLLAHQARESADAERRLGAAWRVLHTFRKITAQINGLYNYQQQQLAAPGAILSPWRVILSIVVPGLDQAFMADDLSIFFKLQQSSVLNNIVDIEEGLRGLRVEFEVYSRLRDELSIQYANQLVQDVSDEGLVALDPRFEALIAMAQSLIANTEAEHRRVRLLTPRLVEAMSPYLDAMGLTLTDVQPTPLV